MRPATIPLHRATRAAAACAIAALALLQACAAPDLVATHRHTAANALADAPASIQPGTTATFAPLLAPFDAAVVSWNVTIPAGAAAALEARVTAGDSQTDWLRIDEAGLDTTTLGEPVFDHDLARVAVEEIFTSTVADALALRIRTTGTTAEPITLHRLDAVLTRIGHAGQPDLPPGLAWAESGQPGPIDAAIKPVRTNAPFHSQATSNPDLAGRLCSPASATMLAGAAGVDTTVEAFAAAAHDPDEDLYGNWVRNVRALADLGVPARIHRFESWPEVASTLAKGHPIVISVTAQPGEIPGANYDLTGGHLMLLTGLNGRGGAEVLDPAFSNPAHAKRTYSMRGLTKAWLARKLGTAYVIAD